MKADVWAVGLIVWEMLAGYRYYAKMSEFDMKQATLKESVHIPEHVQVSEECRKFLFQLLEKDPDKRLSADHALYHPWIWQKSSSRSKSGSGSLHAHQHMVGDHSKHHATQAHVTAMSSTPRGATMSSSAIPGTRMTRQRSTSQPVPPPVNSGSGSGFHHTYGHGHAAYKGNYHHPSTRSPPSSRHHHMSAMGVMNVMRWVLIMRRVAMSRHMMMT